MKLVFSISKTWVVAIILIVIILILLMAQKLPFIDSEAQLEAVDQVLKTVVEESLPETESEPVTVELTPELLPKPVRDESLLKPTELEPEDQDVLKAVGRGPFAHSEAIKVQERFKVDPPMQLIGNEWKAGRGTSVFIMPVSQERNLNIQVERFESIGEDGGEFIGTVIGAPGSAVNLSYRASAEAGRIDIPSEGRSYQILPGQDGGIIVQDRNPSLEVQAGAISPPSGIELPPVPNFIPPPPPSGIFEAIPPTDLLP